ncbi:MAG: DNA internalization-related competence protein ComEC/Rec2 [Gemmatimonadaceae bacterium]
MPLLFHAVAAYAAGLWLGLSHLVWAGAAAVVLSLAIAWLSDDLRLAALAMTLLAGALVAGASGARHERCREIGARRTRWSMTLTQAAAPGAFIPATASWSGCSVPASLSISAGTAAAGATVNVSGEAVTSKQGIMVRHAIVGRVAGRDALLALRGIMGDRIDAAFGADAPLVRALLIADTHSIDPGVRDRFAAAGIVHMLSISGLHVAIIAAAMELLFVAMRLPRSAALCATMVVVAAYIALIGAPPPAVRSGVMLGAAAVARLAQRPISTWGALALGAAVPLGHAATVLDLGWQLSVAGMASLIASGVLARRWIAPRLDGWRAGLATVGLASTVASAVTAPLVAWHFGRISLIAPLTNIVATPIVALLQPALFLATLCSFVPEAARFLAGAAHPMLVALNAVADVGASVPFASVQVAPTLLGALLAGVATLALLVASVSRHPASALVAALASIALALWLPLVPHHANGMELHLIDVGQGDAIALRTPAGRWILVDAGRAWRGGDAGRSTVIPYLRRRGGPLALFVLSHPHSDHVGGASSVLRALHPAQYWDGAYAGTSDPYRASLLTARDVSVRWHRAAPGDTLTVDGVSLRVLAPDSAWMTTLDDPNEGSVVVLAQYGDERFLLMGDAERGEEQWLLRRDPAALHADVLKVGHHGSMTSSTAEFVHAVAPRLALVSVGAGNSYGHPSQSVLRTLARTGAAILRTDRSGTVVVRTDGHSLEIEQNGDRWRLSNVSSPP